MNDPLHEMVCHLTIEGKVKRRRLWWLPHRFIAITLPPFGIYVRRAWCESNPSPERVDRLLRHEAVHWEQWQRWGWKVYTRYLWLWLLHGYKDHPHEVEARERSR